MKVQSSAQLTVDHLQNHIQRLGIQALLHRNIGHTPTVPAAARALGVTPDQIVKTLLFTVEFPRPAQNEPARPEQLIVVISHGERRIEKGLLANRYGTSRKRVRLASAPVVLEHLGYPAGGVPPFGHRHAVPVLLDASLVQSATAPTTTIFAGGGDDQTMMELTIGELLRVTSPEILPLSQG